MTKFYLIRHAESPWSPDEQRPLSTRGLAQAEKVAEAIIACEPSLTAIYSSPYRRAYETVSPLALRLKLNIRMTNELCERRLAGKPIEDFLAAVAATWRDLASALPGGESNEAAQKRGVTLIERLRIRYPEGCLVLSTHGNLLALMLQYFDPSVDFAFWQALTMPDIYCLQLDGTRSDIVRVWEPG